MTDFTQASLSSVEDRSAVCARGFRALLGAMAEPGRVVAPSCGVLKADGLGLSPAAARILAVLADADAPWWLASDVAGRSLIDALSFDCAARPAPSPERAAFLCGGWAALRAEALDRASIGDAEYPDRGATLIVEVEALTGGAAAATLTGPGLAEPRRVAPRGLGPEFWVFMAANRARFPLGLDLFLTAGAEAMALPRSVRAEADRS